MYTLDTRPFACELESSTSFKLMKELVPSVIDDVLQVPTRVSKGQIKTKSKAEWHLKKDLSTECELATPVFSGVADPLYTSLLAVADKLKELGVTTSEADGLHFHIDIPDVNKDVLRALWISYERQIMQFFPAERSSKHSIDLYVQTKEKLKKKLVANFMTEDGWRVKEHFQVLSFYYHDKRKSVEFRAGEGTFEKKEINTILMFFLCIIEKAKAIQKNGGIIELLCNIPTDDLTLSGVPKTLDQLGVTDKPLRQALFERFIRYNPSYKNRKALIAKVQKSI